jgi:uncharacterized protein (TIGR00369 family)
MSQLFEFGKNVLKSQPFSVLLDAQLIFLDVGIAEIAITPNDQMKQQHGFLHGGVVSYLADNTLTFAGGSILGDSLTSEFKINYLRPCIGERIIARSKVVHAGKNQAVCQCEVIAIKDGKEKVVAVAQGTVNKAATPKN